MARRKKPAETKRQLPWLITFSDLMTLLLTFFIMLISMATIDERSKRLVLGSLVHTFGPGERVFNPLSSKSNHSLNEPGVMEGKNDDLVPMRDMVHDDTEKDLNFQENRYVQIFSISDRVLFLPGGTTLSPRGEEILDRILPYLQRLQYPLLVAGHTASRRDEESAQNYTAGLDQNSVDSTWSISFHRALAVYRHLTDRGISPERLTLEAFGQHRPRHSNNTLEGRGRNRRVDLVLDKRNGEWIQKVEALRGTEQEKKPPTTYFRGFKFDLSPPDEPPVGKGADL